LMISHVLVKGSFYSYVGVITGFVPDSITTISCIGR
jgi:hypothetical protein